MSDTDGREPHAGDASRAGDGGPRWPSLPDGGSPPARRTRRAAHAGGDDAAATPAGGTPSGAVPAGTDPRPASGAHAAVPAATPVTSGTGSSPDDADQPGGAAGDAADEAPARSGRRRGLVIGAVVAGVVLVGGGIAAALLLGGDGDDPAAGPAPVVTLPSPTATATPVAREADSPFAAALPTTLLQYALAESAPDDEWLGADALEAWSETYSDGGSGSVTVRAGQWETAEEAAAVLAGLRDALPAVADAAPGDDATSTAAATDAPSAGAAGGGPAVLLEDDVVVDGEPVGEVTVVDAGDGTGVAVWSNGTAVFQVTGPAADIRNLYAAYPL